MNSNSSRFDIEWWVVPKRLIYITITLLTLGVGAGGAGVYLWLHGNPFKGAPLGSAAPSGARFVSFEGDVRVVRAQTRETVTAHSDTQLYPGDIVQTAGDGRARILFVDGSTCFVRPDSVVAIRDNTSVEGGARTNVRVAVDQGEINVRTEKQTENTSNVVETRLTENRLAAQTGASFDVHADHTENIRVSTGGVETTTRGGEKTTLRGGEYVAINQTGGVARRERLLDIPAPIAPHDLEKITAKENGTANISLRWTRPVSGTPAHYSVEVATSPFFVATGKVIERDQLDATEFMAGDLRQGVYFWRVRAVAASGQASDWSDPQKFTVAPKGTGERVALSDVSYEYVAGDIYIVHGRSQPGNTVRIAGRRTLAAANGSFQLQITVPRGAHEIMVEAEDPQGNKNRYELAFSPDATKN